MGARTGPLQVGDHILGGQAQARAEGRRVHLGHAVNEDHLAGDAVGIEHADALFVIPCAGELLLDARAPLVVDLLDKEGFFRGFYALRLDGIGEIECLTERGIDVIAVHMPGKTRVAIG